MCVLCIYCLYSTPFWGGKPDHNNARGFCIPRKSQKPVTTVMMTLSCERNWSANHRTKTTAG